MHKTENVKAPLLAGWAIGLAAGLVAFGVLIVVGDFDLFPAAAIATAVALVVGLILGLPGGPREPSVPVRGPAVAHVADPAPLAASAVAPPAAFMAAPADEPAPVAHAAPAAVAPAGAGPLRLTAPRDGRPDNLQEIEGIGPAMEKLVNQMGFFHFDQIAGWSDADVAVVDAEMKSFKGRIARDRWVAQAKIIVNEGIAAFRERARTNNY